MHIAINFCCGSVTVVQWLTAFCQSRSSCPTRSYRCSGGVAIGLLEIRLGFNSNTPFQTVNLSNFGNIDRLVFDGISGGFSLDNAVFDQASNNVPEPGSLALLGLAFAGLAANRRRKAGK